MYLSVIVPVYNGEKYIDELIQSLEQQSFKNFETILVDDGSKDNSYEKCMEYERKYSWVRVIHTENAGVSNARNTGLQNACGEWVQFIDVDDVISENTFEEFYKVSQAQRAELIICGCDRIMLKSNEKVYCGPEKSEFLNRDGMKDLLHHLPMTDRYWALDYVWNKWFKREIIMARGLSFCKSMCWGEDFEFNARYCKEISSMALIAEPFYQYRVGEEGLVSRFREEAWVGGMQIYQAQKSLYEKFDLWKTDETWVRCQNGHIASGNLKLINSIKCTYNAKEKRAFIKEFIRNEQFAMILEYLKSRPSLPFKVYHALFSTRNSWLIYNVVTMEKYAKRIIRKDR